VLIAEPRLATLTGDGDPPLMYLPGDETRARAIAELFLAHGADPSLKNRDGMTAADLARKRGLDEAADLLDCWNGGTHAKK
jgi:ankyrin repeat protein